MNVYKYDKLSAIKYAQKWAKARNPFYYNFDKLGGDCTNFVSQCLFAGSGVMNYTNPLGWYYNSLNDRASAWSGVEFLHNFLINNNGAGVFGKSDTLSQISIGDLIFLVKNEVELYHSVIVTRIDNQEIYVCAHTFDALNRPLSTYPYQSIRPVKILGYRK